MKRIFSLRLPLSLLPLLAIFTLLSCRTSIRQTPPLQNPSPPHNTTLLRLAAQDPTEAALRKDVETLLEGNFPPSAARFAARSPRRDPKLSPPLRQSLRNWWRNRRFQPEIMSRLGQLVRLPQDRYSSCAVVGNSGILLNSDYGEVIDGHQMVIRLNNARTHGYRRKVGSKTGLSFVNSNILHLCARRFGCFCHPYGEDVPIVMYICQVVHFVDYAVCNSSHKAPLVITDIRFDMLCGRIVKYYSLKRFGEVTGKAWDDWGKFHDEKMFHYSSGMQAVMLALGICDRVSVFGFGKSKDARHHYHTNQKAELDLHDYDAEYDFYQDLVDRPQEIPFLKDSGFKVPPLVFYH